MVDSADSTGSAPVPPPLPEAETTQPRYRGGSTAGVVLILLGLALLASRWAPGISVWMLWPLFIIVPGIVQCFTPGHDGWTPHRFLDGVVSITVGLVFLGNTTGYLSWGVWWQVLQFWPVLLISAGLGLLGKSLSQEWLRAVGKAVVLLAFAYVVAMSLAGGDFAISRSSGGTPFSHFEPVGGTERAELTLKYGVGDLTVDSDAGSRLISVEGESPFSTPSFRTTSSGGRARIDFNLGDADRVAVFPGSLSAQANVSLSERVVWDIGIDSGVSSLEMDLSEVEVASLTLKTGVSSNRIRLGDVIPGRTEGNVTVQTGVSSVTLLVPEGVEARIESQSGLTGHSVSRDFESLGGNVWQTADFERARSAGDGVWIITVKAGLGTFTVETY